MTTDSEKMRLDKWLWAARFFKTRSLANHAISGGKIRIDGQRCKPSKLVDSGSVLSISKGDVRWTITILSVSKHRRPATEARLLYQESEESIQLRSAAISQRKLTKTTHMPKPDKRARRQIRSMTGKDE